MSGIKISKPGHPVDSALPRDQVFNSEFNNMKVAVEITGTFNAQTMTLPHGQQQVPVHLAYIRGEFGLAGAQAWILIPMSSPQNAALFFSADADETNIYLRRSAAPSDPFEIYRVFVFADPTR